MSGPGEFELSVEALRRVVRSESAYERAHAGLLYLYALSGERQRALVQYERLWEPLFKELEAEPGAASRHLHEQIVEVRFPPARLLQQECSPEESLSAGRHNLLYTLTSFVGRERELIEDKCSWRRHGYSSSQGPTARARRASPWRWAETSRGVYPNGAWLAELAGLSEGSFLAHQEREVERHHEGKQRREAVGYRETVPLERSKAQAPES